MSQDGKEILAAIRSVRRLYGDVALLLKTAQKLAEAEAWQPASGNTATANSSAAIYAPDSWAPQHAFRFFKHPERPQVLAIVAVILDEIDIEDRLKEPLITGAWWKYSPEKQQDKNWLWEYSKFHLWTEGHTTDGAWTDVDVQKIGAAEKFGIVEARSFAVPLVDVQNEADIREKVIGPLFTSVEERTSTP